MGDESPIQKPNCRHEMARTTHKIVAATAGQHPENNISLTSLTLLRLGASHTTGEYTLSVMCLCGTSKFVGVASISFRHFVNLLAPLNS